MYIDEILQFVNSGGVIGILIFILIGGFRKIWIFGWAYQEEVEREKQMRVERDMWQELALQGTDLAERAIRLKS